MLGKDPGGEVEGVGGGLVSGEEEDEAVPRDFPFRQFHLPPVPRLQQQLQDVHPLQEHQAPSLDHQAQVLSLDHQAKC